MTGYILKRLLLMIPTLLIISIVTYAIIRMAPGDPIKASMLASGNPEGNDRKAGESESAKKFKKVFALDKPWYVGYWYWLTGNPNVPDSVGVLRGDFGQSVVLSLGTPVTDLIRSRIPPTLKLNLLSLIIVYLVAIPTGIYSAVRHNGLFDRGSSFVFLILYSLPSFWVGLLLILLSAAFFPWWPTSGLESTLPLTASYWEILKDTALRYVFPVFCLSYASFAYLSRFSRSAILEVIRQDYVRTARAKGVNEFKVISVHVLRNGLISMITIFANLLPGLIAGSTLIEYVFNIQGMGKLGIEAVTSRDYPVLMSLFAISAVLTLLGILLGDIAYCIADPRISLDKKEV